jgi:glyoxylase-like metal-dependent hydrolase (beta-lactamase superfamily II)
LGFIENDIALNLLLHNQATVDDKAKPAQWHRVPSIALLISHPKLGWILVDTGSNKKALEGYWPESALKKLSLIRSTEDMLDYRLAQIGLKPSDIDLLVITHLHLDHAGNLQLFSGTKAGRMIVAHEEEIKQALYDTFMVEGDLVNGYLRPDFVGLPDIAFDPIDSDVKLADDLELIWLPGHTPGTIGIVIHLEKSGTIIYTSDAVNWEPNFGPPIQLSAVFYDSVSMKRMTRHLYWLQKQYNAMLIFGHDMNQYQKLRLAPDGYYD